MALQRARALATGSLGPIDGSPLLATVLVTGATATDRPLLLASGQRSPTALISAVRLTNHKDADVVDSVGSGTAFLNLKTNAVSFAVLKPPCQTRVPDQKSLARMGTVRVTRAHVGMPVALVAVTGARVGTNVEVGMNPRAFILVKFARPITGQRTVRSTRMHRLRLRLEHQMRRLAPLTRRRRGARRRRSNRMVKRLAMWPMPSLRSQKTHKGSVS